MPKYYYIDGFGAGLNFEQFTFDDIQTTYSSFFGEAIFEF